MRIFELIFTIILFLRITLKMMQGTKSRFSVIFESYHNKGTFIVVMITAILAICLEGFRFVMLPLYLLGLIFCLFETICLFKEHSMKQKRMKDEQLPVVKKKYILKFFGMIFFCILFVLSTILAWYVPVVNLPKPSGNSKVGTVIMDFINPGRTNILTGKKERQKIAAQFWYPAADTKGRQCAAWMRNRKMAGLFAKYEGLPDVFGQFTMVKTNSYLNAPLADTTEKYPVILFSGGGGMFSGQNVIQMEELASNGFIVVAVSHPLDDFATLYSDGTIAGYDDQLSDAINADMSQAIRYMKDKYKTNVATPEMQRTTISAAKLSDEEVRVWAQDLSFIADQIIKMNGGSIESIFQGKIDTKELGVFGHSLGGAAAGQTCLTDNRFKAFINMDGTPFGDTVNQLINQPFMILETGLDSNIKFRAGDGYSPKQKNYLTVSIAGTEHMNFTDFNTILPNIGKKIGILGTINTVKQTKITNAYVLAFFSHYLKRSAEPLLETSRSPFTEVKMKQK